LKQFSPIEVNDSGYMIEVTDEYHFKMNRDLEYENCSRMKNDFQNEEFPKRMKV
jgi:hypothetical protein